MKQHQIFDYIWFALLAAFVLLGFRFEYLSNISQLDPSWVYALNDIALQEKYHFGKDIFFTYGPFGYLLYPIAHPDILPWALALKISVITLWVLVLFSYRHTTNALLSLFLLCLAFGCCGHGLFRGYQVFTHTNYEILAVALTFTYLRTTKKFWLIAFNLLSVFLFFAKFNLGLLYLAVLLILLCSRKFNPKDLAISFVCWLIGLGLIIVYKFSDISAFVAWFKTSAQIAAAYSENMTLSSNFNQGYTLLAICQCLAILGLFIWDCRHQASRLKYLAVLTPALFFAYKAGIVRSDEHLLTFFSFIMSLSALLLLYLSPKLRNILLALYLSAFISTYKFISFGSIAFDIAGLQQLPPLTAADSYTLPRQIISTIKDHDIEILPIDMSLLAKYPLHAHYNPLLQLYTAYSASLDQLSAANYTSQKPTFLFINGSYFSIDNRNFFYDTPTTWRAIKQNYQIHSLTPTGFLLRRRKTPLVSDMQTLSVKSYNFGQPITVIPNATHAAIDIKLSLIGQLFKLFYRVAPLYIVIQTEHGIYTFRQMRDVLKNSIKINELIANPKNLIDYINDNPIGNHIKSLAFYSPATYLYQQTIHVNWQQENPHDL